MKAEQLIKRGVPLIGVETADSRAWQQQLQPPTGVLLLAWDVYGGLQGEAAACGEDRFLGEAGAVEAVKWVIELQAPAWLVMHGAHRYINDAAVAQALCHARDALKQVQACILLAAPNLQIPEELRQDVWMLEDPLPTVEQLKDVARALRPSLEAAGATLTEEEVDKAAEMLRGLTRFGAEQTLAVAASKQGMRFAELQSRKRAAINAARGVQLYEEKGDGYAALAGLEAGKEFLRSILQGRNAPLALCLIDEIDKQMEGSTGGDLSGVAAGFHGALLSWTQDYGVLGMLLYGIPGTGKTALMKAASQEFGIPLLMIDLGAMRGGLVGESEANLRAALKIVESISEPGRVLVVGTCNRLNALSPELEDRLALGSFFYDYPTGEGLAQSWDIWSKRYELPQQERPKQSVKLVHRDIAQTCEKAWRMNCSLQEASRWVVPSAARNREALEQLRRAASGRFLDVNTGGLFQHHETAAGEKPETGARALSLDDAIVVAPMRSLVQPGPLAEAPARTIGF